jgi:hypothetical protein
VSIYELYLLVVRTRDTSRSPTAIQPVKLRHTGARHTVLHLMSCVQGEHIVLPV